LRGFLTCAIDERRAAAELKIYASFALNHAAGWRRAWVLAATLG